MPETHRPDQALGLRRLFESQGTRLLPVIAAAGEMPGRAALAVARAVNATGHRCLVIDATRGEVATALGLAARYELRHATLGDRRLDDVVLSADGALRVLPASRGFSELVSSDAPFERLARLVDALGSRGDWVLIAADAPKAEAAVAFAGGGEVAIACRSGSEGRTAAYAVMKRIARAADVRRFRLLVAGRAGAEAASRALAGVTERFLGVDAVFGAALDTAPTRRAERGACERLARSIAGWECATLAVAPQAAPN